MKRRMITGILVLLLIVTQAGAVYANTTGLNTILPGVTGEAETEAAFQVLVPLKDRVTSRETMVVSFRAPQGSAVTVEVFHRDAQAAEDSFEVLYEPMEFAIGILERGWVELQLKKGVNRLVFSAQLPRQSEGQEPSLEVMERIVTVKDLEEVREEMTRSVLQTTTSDLIRRLTNMNWSPGTLD